MAGEIASTTFSSGPQDKLAVADVYKQTKTSVINSFQDIRESTGFDVLGLLKGTNLTSLSGIIKTVKDGKLNLDPTAVLTRLIGTNDKLKGMVKDVEKSIATGVNIPMSLKNDVTATVNGNKSIVDGSDLTSVKGLAGMINTVTNGGYNAAFVDKGALAGLVGGISTQASKLGLPNVFSSLTSVTNDRSIMVNAVKNIVPDAVKTGDVALLADIADTVYGKEIRKVYPNFANDVARVVNKPTGLKSKDISGYYDRVTGMFAKADPNWNMCTRSANIVGPEKPTGSDVLDVSPLLVDNDFTHEMVKMKAMEQHMTLDSTNLYDSDESAGSLLSAEKITYATMQEDNNPEVLAELKAKYPFINPEEPVSSVNDKDFYSQIPDSEFYKQA